ncbi:bis-aminopropyl spermidine synthase family protein [Candidatus Aerophobetes bacterium]|nr:bis-aminopropyl spermidine synthase family protein [Candidatus Aerophobetes bacterium]
MKQAEQQILRQLVRGPKDFWQLITHQDASIKEFVDILNKLEEKKIIRKRNSVFSISEEGRTFIKPYLDSKCPCCEQGINLEGEFSFLREEFKKVAENRPLPRAEYDQGFMRRKDTVKRVIFMYERGDIERREIFILGDDDLLGLALGILNLHKRITIIEIDERVVTFIQKKIREYGFRDIEVLRGDVLKEFSPQLSSQFDTFVTDPPESELGFKFFVRRCMEALKGRESVGYLGLTYLESSLRKWQQFEKFFLEANFVITDILRDFSFYPEGKSYGDQWENSYQSYRVFKELKLPFPEKLWYRSSFVRFQAVGEINLLPLPAIKSFKELYLDKETWATPDL